MNTNAEWCRKVLAAENTVGEQKLTTKIPQRRAMRLFINIIPAKERKRCTCNSGSWNCDYILNGVIGKLLQVDHIKLHERALIFATRYYADLSRLAFFSSVATGIAAICLDLLTT